MTNITTHQLKLFSTAGCHLCEQVEQMLEYAISNNRAELNGLEVDLVDIASDEALLTEFAVRIPVLQMNHQQLDFPFEYPQLLNWLMTGVKKGS